MYDAMQQARAKYLAEMPADGRVTIDMGYAIAEGFFRGGADYAKTTKVQAFFDNQGRLVTVFGLLPRGVIP